MLHIFRFFPHFSFILCPNLTFVMAWSKDFTSKQYILHKLRPRTKLYNLFVQFQYCNLNIFGNIAHFPFFTPFQLHLVPKSHFSVGLEQGLYFKTVYFTQLPPRTILYYLFVQFQHYNLTIFDNIALFPFFTPISASFCAQISPLCWPGARNLFQNSRFYTFATSYQIILPIRAVLSL